MSAAERRSWYGRGERMKQSGNNRSAKGVALAGATVTVNSQSPYRRTEYFRRELTVVNSSTPVWQGVSVAATGETTVTGNIFVPQTPESYGYDADGNLTSDGRWTYTWDGENRLATMAARTAVGPQVSLRFDYDGMGRRMRKRVWDTVTFNGNLIVDQRFVYDGWNLIAMLDAQSSILQSFVWGLDLSGTMQGAGGVGGLLWGSDTASGAHFAGYDGNGNVVVLVSAADGTVTANYEYGPFGEPIRGKGAVAEANPFRFSTKFVDEENGLVYYGYRYHSPPQGRWPSRDPFGEEGFEGNKYFSFKAEDLQSLESADFDEEDFAIRADNALRALGKATYVMVNNEPMNTIDLYGLVCGVVANRTKSPLSSGINAGHEWLEYGPNSVGFWPRFNYIVLRPDPGQTTRYPVYWQWETKQKKSGKIKWGPAAGTDCSCATCPQILACLDAAPNPGWRSFPVRNNCRRFAKWALNGCCLKKGKKTSFP